MAPPPTPRKSRSRRWLKWLAASLLLLLVLAFARGLYVFRDRHPGYTLDLAIEAKPDQPRPLQVGFGRIKINPDLSDPHSPIWIAGFAQNRAATAIHDDLWAIACVVDDGHTRIGLVGLDAIGFFHDDVITVRQRLKPEWDIDYALVASTHNHSTPDLMGLWGPNYRNTGVNDRYREQVIEGAVRALERAVTSLTPARVVFDRFDVPTEGLVADTRKPIVFDPAIRLMHFLEPEQDKTIGTIVTWANHPETVWSKNTEITAGFPGFLREALEHGVRVEGPKVQEGRGGIHLYINGAIGGLMSTTPKVTVRDPYLEQDFKAPTHDKARAVGHQLAWHIFPRLDTGSMTPTNQLPISVRARTVELPLENKGYLLAGYLGLIDRGHVRWRHIRSELALIQMGNVSMACIPGEIYPELVNGGMENSPGADFRIEPVEVPPLRDLMPGEIKFVLGLANDEIGYIIPKSEWDVEPPYLYGSEKGVYGEINSLGPETARLIHDGFRRLMDEEPSGQ